MTNELANLGEELEEIMAIEGERDQRVRTLLWLARTFYGQDDIDSYSGVFTDPQMVETDSGNVRIDGLVNHTIGDELHHVAFVWVDAERRSASLTQALKFAEALVARPEAMERALARNGLAGQLVAEMRPLRRAAQVVQWRVAVVSPSDWNPAEGRKVSKAAEGRVDRWDPRRLRDLASARLDPSWLEETTHIEVSESERLETTAGGRRVFVAPVSGVTIANWPGIESRRLFDLNVRFGLGTRNRVRQSLDSALATDDQREFIASHNGLTVVCESVTPTPNRLTVENFSVVNGAQSVIALHENLPALSPDLKVIVKFVEVGENDRLASEIAIRSNTQNPVTGRNLRALDLSQVRLREELARRQYAFNTRPDSRSPAVDREIKNDDAAQWICAVYLERPWLAVKRTSLFAPDVFAEIFPPSITAEHIILLHSMRQILNSRKDEFPEELRRAWLLTALTAMYLTGQLMRFDDRDRATLLEPAPGDGDGQRTVDRLRELTTQVIDYMTARHTRVVEREGYDNFRVEFKRQRTLLELSSEMIRSARAQARGAERE